MCVSSPQIVRDLSVHLPRCEAESETSPPLWFRSTNDLRALPVQYSIQEQETQHKEITNNTLKIPP